MLKLATLPLRAAGLWMLLSCGSLVLACVLFIVLMYGGHLFTRAVTLPAADGLTHVIADWRDLKVEAPFTPTPDAEHWCDGKIEKVIFEMASEENAYQDFGDAEFQKFEREAKKR